MNDDSRPVSLLYTAERRPVLRVASPTEFLSRRAALSLNASACRDVCQCTRPVIRGSAARLFRSTRRRNQVAINRCRPESRRKDCLLRTECHILRCHRRSYAHLDIGDVPMAGTQKGFASIDDYIAALPADSQLVVAQVRALVHDTVRGVTERISYDIPTFDLNGQPLVYFGAWKKHIGLYPATGRVVAHFGDEFAPYTLGKGTIQFPLNKPMPMALIKRIIEFRASEVRSAG